VISSYTPTIRALSQARAARASSPSRGEKALVIVAVPDAHASAPLPGVTREAALLRELVPDATTLPSPGTVATRESVTSALPRHRIAHFATASPTSPCPPRVAYSCTTTSNTRSPSAPSPGCG